MNVVGNILWGDVKNDCHLSGNGNGKGKRVSGARGTRGSVGGISIDRMKVNRTNSFRTNVGKKREKGEKG